MCGRSAWRVCPHGALVAAPTCATVASHSLGATAGQAAHFVVCRPPFSFSIYILVGPQNAKKRVGEQELSG